MKSESAIARDRLRQPQEVRMLKWIQSLAIGLGIVSIFALSPQIARADDPPSAKLYGTYCAACHGAGGKGGGAPAIGAEEFLSAKDDAAITRITSEGNVSKGMPAWSKAKGGALSDDQIASIVAYLRSLATTVNVSASAPQLSPNVFSIETKLFVTQSSDADGSTALNALLQEYSGYPVAGASIVFTRATSWGVVEVGTAKTGANGIATLTVSEVPMSAREVVVTFKGDKKFDAVTTKIALESRTEPAPSSGLNLNGVQLSIAEPLLPAEGSLITPNPPLLPTILIVLVVGCVWMVYGYVLYQLYEIPRHAGIEPRENTLKNRWR